MKPLCIYVYVQHNSSLTARYARDKPHPRPKEFWHKCRFLNYPWVDMRPAKYLGVHTSLIAEYLLKPLEIRKSCASAVARTPDIRVQRPFVQITRLGELGQGEASKGSIWGKNHEHMPNVKYQMSDPARILYWLELCSGGGYMCIMLMMRSVRGGPLHCKTLDELRLWLQEERTAKGELKQLLASTVQSERAADKKLAEVSAELEAASAKLAKAEAALQVSAAFSLLTNFRGLTILLRHHALFTSGKSKTTRCLSCFA